MAFAEEVTVFADTNLGTHIVLTVPMDITAGDIKRKLEKAHANCLPNLGEIQVNGLMVKRKSHFYHIAETVPMKYTFKNNQTPWFICAKATLVKGSQEPSISNTIDQAKTIDCAASDKSIKGVTGLSQGQNKKMKKPLAKQILKRDSIILDKKELLGSSTTNPKTRRSSLSRGATEMKHSKNFIQKTRERKPGESVDSQTISKKLLVAANNIRMQGKTRISSSLLSIFRFKTCRKKSEDGKKKVSSLAKFQVFQISDNED